MLLQPDRYISFGIPLCPSLHICNNHSPVADCCVLGQISLNSEQIDCRCTSCTFIILHSRLNIPKNYVK